MISISDLFIPLTIAFILIFGLFKKVKVFDVFVAGAKTGIATAFRILPSLIAIMTGIVMFKASGALELITGWIAPLTDPAGIPKELIPLALLRPISGSGALALFQDILGTYGPDSFLGKVASVMQGSTETTFYTIAIYYSATKVNQTGRTLPCSLTGDVTSFLFSILAIRILFP